MQNKTIKTISIRGRIAYTIKCLQTFVDAKYSDIDFKSVINMACSITDNSDYIDESAMAYMEIIPEYLYEFDSYPDAEFEYISEEQFNHFRNIIPSDDVDLNTIMKSIYNIAMEYSYESMEPGAPRTLSYIQSVKKILDKNKLPLPDIAFFSKFSFSENDGWGSFINKSEYL